eukprot:2310050-Rhodomonas_salina.2
MPLASSVNKCVDLQGVCSARGLKVDVDGLLSCHTVTQKGDEGRRTLADLTSFVVHVKNCLHSRQQLDGLCRCQEKGVTRVGG